MCYLRLGVHNLHNYTTPGFVRVQVYKYTTAYCMVNILYMVCPSRQALGSPGLGLGLLMEDKPLEFHYRK